MGTKKRIGRLCAAAAVFLAAQSFAQSLPPGTHTQAGITYATQNGKPLELDIYSPATPPAVPAAVLVRFSPERESPAGAAASLLNQGFVLVYAGYLPVEAAAVDGPAKSFSRFPADLFAAKAAIRYVRGNAVSLHIDKNRIGVWGAEHGGADIALLLPRGHAALKNLAGTLGDFPQESSAVSALCLFEGITDWRNAELYGDETTNIPGTPAYQLFGGNPKEHTDDARSASAVNYITPQSPCC